MGLMMAEGGEEIMNLLQLPGTDPLAMKEKLVFLVNELIQHNFNRLVYILYRVDVDEQKLKKILQEEKEKDAAETIANLLIDRQLEKNRNRNAFRKSNDAAEEEW